MSGLTFNVCDGRLSGSIDRVQISAQAVSGGRGGSKVPGAVNDLIVNNPFTTGMKNKKDQVGGVLPLTTYMMRTRERRGNWIRLIAVDPSMMHGRDGMAIHGRGAQGSHGCIVPTDFNVVVRIYKLLQAREEKGKAAPILSVVAIGDLDYYLERMRKMAATA